MLGFSGVVAMAVTHPVWPSYKQQYNRQTQGIKVSIHQKTWRTSESAAEHQTVRHDFDSISWWMRVGMGERGGPCNVRISVFVPLTLQLSGCYSALFQSSSWLCSLPQQC